MLAKIWAFVLPVLKSPAVWSAVVSLIVGAFGVPMLMPAPTVSLPAPMQVKPMELVVLQSNHTGSNIDWDHDAPDAKMLFFGSGTAIVQFPTAGKYRVHAHVARYGKLAHAQTLVTVGDSPTPPGPNPPDPPTPPAPIPAKGLHVLIVIDTANLSKLPAAQVQSLSADAVRQYLNATCPAGPDGKTKEWRIWDAQGDVSHESQLWQDAFKRAAGKTLPYIIVSNPDHGGGFEGALPADADSLLALLKKFGG